jgi:hypothetical protein
MEEIRESENALGIVAGRRGPLSQIARVIASLGCPEIPFNNFVASSRRVSAKSEEVFKSESYPANRAGTPVDVDHFRRSLYSDRIFRMSRNSFQYFCRLIETCVGEERGGIKVGKLPRQPCGNGDC